MVKLLNQFLVLLITAVISFSCVLKNGQVSVSAPKRIMGFVTVSKIELVNNQLILTGINLDKVKNVKIEGNNLNETFSIEYKSTSKLVANSIRGIKVGLNAVANLVLADASASATFPVDFSLCNATLNGTQGFDCNFSANNNDVLTFVNGKWIPRAISLSGLVYVGAYNASMGVVPAGAIPGEYWIISVAGMINSVAYKVGDWIVYNGTTWDKVDNSTAVSSVFGRTGVITAAKNDYSLGLMSDVTIGTLTGADNGKVLTYNGTAWIPQAPVAGGSGTVTAVTGTAPIAVASGTTTPIISISQANTTTAGYLSAADWNIFNSKLSSTLADGKILIGNAGTATAVSLSGDATIINTGVLTLKNTGTAGTYTSVTTDAQGRVTGGSNPAVVGSVGVTAPITNTGTASAPVLAIPAATTAVNGYLKSADWNTFSGKADLTNTLQTITALMVTGVSSPSANSDVTNKLYVDNLVSNSLSANGVWNKSTTTINYMAGNVGVGTTTPAAKFEVHEADGVSVIDSLRLSRNSGAAVAPAAAEMTLATSRGTTAAPTALQSGDPSGSIDFQGYDGAAIGDGAEIAAFTAGVWSNTSHPTDIKFSTVPTASTVLAEVMRITSTGNVGIGTSTPGAGAKLDIEMPNGSNGINMFWLGSHGNSNTDMGQMLFRHSDATSTAQNSAVIRWGTTTGTDGYMNFYAAANGSNAMTLGMSINGAGNVGIGTTSPQSKLDVNGSVRLGVDATACSATIAGAMRFNTPNIEYCNGTSWTAFGVAGAGVTGLNGSAVSTQSFATPGTSGTAPAWSTNTGTGVHTLNIPLAATASVTAGLLSKADYDIFNAKLGTTTVFAGDVSGTYGATSVDKIKGTPVAITTITTKNVLKYDGTNWINSMLAASDISDFNAGVLAAPLTGLSAAAGSITTADTVLSSMNKLAYVNSDYVSKSGSNTVTGAFNITGIAAFLNIPTPTGTTLTEAANVNYVQTYVGSLGQWTKGTGANAADIYRASGNVGIGTTSPAGKLNVVDTVASQAILNQYSTDTNPARITMRKSRGTVAVPLTVNNGDTLGDILFQGTPDGTNFKIGSWIGSAVDAGTVSSTSMPSFLYFGTTAINSVIPTERMRIDENGNVGIGTTAPGSSRLNINSPYSGTNPNAAGSSISVNNSNDTLIFGVAPGSAWIQSYLQGGANSGYGAEYLLLNPNGGNVGIGTTTPASTLDVNGAIKSVAVTNATSTIDFATGNLQYTSASCGAFTLSNLKSGGTYTLAVQGAAGGTCSFTATGFTVKTGSVTLTQTANKHTIFSFMVMGTFVYVAAIDGY